MRRKQAASGPGGAPFFSGAVLFLFGLLLLANPLQAQRSSRASVSLRGGFWVNEKDQGFRQVDVFADFRLPLQWQSHSGWLLAVRLDAGAGVLNESGSSAFVVSLGPGFLLTKQGWPLLLKLGSSPSYLSDPVFPRKDLGGSFHFISHIGFAFRVFRQVELIYRIQHLSNASRIQPNPGLNLHVFGVGIAID